MKLTPKEATSTTTFTYPLCKASDMPNEAKQEAMEICVTAIEKFHDNYEHAAKFIKESLDKRFDPSFQVVIGKGFGHAITSQEKSLLLMFTAENIAALVWKTESVY